MVGLRIRLPRVVSVQQRGRARPTRPSSRPKRHGTKAPMQQALGSYHTGRSQFRQRRAREQEHLDCWQCLKVFWVLNCPSAVSRAATVSTTTLNSLKTRFPDTSELDTMVYSLTITTSSASIACSPIVQQLSLKTSTGYSQRGLSSPLLLSSGSQELGEHSRRHSMPSPAWRPFVSCGIPMRERRQRCTGQQA